jgi:hypothetical protein
MIVLINIREDLIETHGDIVISGAYDGGNFNAFMPGYKFKEIESKELPPVACVAVSENLTADELAQLRELAYINADDSK